jgi:hypothetical protein
MGAAQYPGKSWGEELNFTAQLLFITTVPITKLFACGEGDIGGHVLWDVYYEPRLVWASLPITHW